MMPDPAQQREGAGDRHERRAEFERRASSGVLREACEDLSAAGVAVTISRGVGEAERAALARLASRGVRESPSAAEFSRGSGVGVASMRLMEPPPSRRGLLA
jgi:hypothetical protein